MAETVGLLNVVSAELVGLIAELLRTGAWEGLGIRSPEHWVVWRCGMSPGRARRLVALARGLEELPRTAARFTAGELGEDQTAEVVRFTGPRHDRQVAEMASSMTVPQLRRVLPSLPRTQRTDDENGAGGPSDDGAGAPAGDDDTDTRDGSPGDGRHDEAGRRQRRLVRFGYSDEGEWWCSARLPADEGALVQRALERARERVFRDRHPERDASPDMGPFDPEVTWSDGLLRLAQAGLDALDRDTARGRPPGERTQVILHLDAERDVPPRLHLGPVLPRRIAEQLACDATVRYLLWQQGQPVAMGRRERTVNPRLRAVVEDRDGGCRVPGCDASRWLHIHHLQHWTKGGRTDPCNLCALCSAHHRMVHQGLLTIAGDANDPNGLIFTDDQGRRLEPAYPRPPNPTDSASQAVADHGLPSPTWLHPSGERLNPHAISWN